MNIKSILGTTMYELTRNQFPVDRKLYTRHYTSISVASRNIKIVNSKTAFDLGVEALKNYKSIEENYQILQDYIKRGASFEPRNKMRESLLHIFARDNAIAPSILLLDNQTHINPRDINGETPLMTASKYPHSFEVLNELIMSGAKVNLLNNNQQSALIIATKSHNTPAVACLLDAKADFYTRDKNGLSAKNYAEKSQYFDIVELLNRAEEDLHHNYTSSRFAKYLSEEEKEL